MRALQSVVFFLTSIDWVNVSTLAAGIGKEFHVSNKQIGTVFRRSDRRSFRCTRNFDRLRAGVGDPDGHSQRICRNHERYNKHRVR